mgnify:CR=1 FL=1
MGPTHGANGPEVDPDRGRTPRSAAHSNPRSRQAGASGRIIRRIRAARHEQGLKSAIMARRLGISLTAYSDLERGRRRLTVDRLEAIMAILGLTWEGLTAPGSREEME